MIRMNKDGKVLRLLDRVEQAYVARGLAKFVDAGELETASRRGGRRGKPADARASKKAAKADVIVDEHGDATVDGAEAVAADDATARVVAEAGEASGG